MIKRSLLLSLLLATGAVQAQDKAAAQPDLAKAKQTAEQVCGACHSTDGNSQIPVNPKLAGQHAEYLYSLAEELQE
jgi:cytochrome c553